MKHSALFAASLACLVTIAGCSGENDTLTSPGRGSLTVTVTPNPILALRIAGMSGTYDFPFEVALSETGGQTVTLTALHVDLKALGVRVFTKTYDASYLQGHNYSPVIPAGSTVRYSFNPREEAPDAAFSSNVEADIRVEGVDDKGNPVSKTKTVSVRRG